MPHTPGPWKGYGHTGYVYATGVVVCRCGDYSDKEQLPFSKDRWAADVRLIAAAPDLAEALDNILIALYLPGAHCDLDSAVKQANAVLAKVRSETSD